MKARPASETIVAGVLMLTPLALAVARRSSALLLAASALLALFRGRTSLAAQWRSARIDRALLAGLGVLVVWAAISLIWSPLPGRGFKQLLFDFAIPVASGLVLIVMQTAQPSRRPLMAWAVALAAGAALVAAQLYFQLRIEDLLTRKGQPYEAWRFNMVVVTLALFLPALLLLMRSLPLAAALAALAIILSAVLSQSATSKLVLLSGVFAFAVFRLLPRRAGLALFGIAVFGLLAIQPWQGQLIESGLRAAGKTDVLFQSAKERIVIWQASGKMALHAMPWGTGMGSSDAVSETPFAKTMPQKEWIGLRQTHAHDAFLNIVMELGLPGLIGLALLAFGVLRTMARVPDAMFAPSMALATQIVTVDLISHGAWQAWWFAAIMLAILALRQSAGAAKAA